MKKSQPRLTTTLALLIALIVLATIPALINHFAIRECWPLAAGYGLVLAASLMVMGQARSWYRLRTLKESDEQRE